ncbi:MAG: carbonic anhydrase family protein [bacterium]
MKTTHLAVCVALIATSQLQAQTAAADGINQRPATPDEAFGRLKAGNERFVSGVGVQRDLLAEAKATSSGQKPFAAIVSCIDSRTSSELVFDQGLGDVFNARLAGNVVDDDVLGSLEFATKVAGAKLIAVVGHSSCGAVVGAIDDVKLGHLTGLLERIRPAVQSSATKDKDNCTSKNPGFVSEVIERNVRLQMNQLTDRSPILRGLVENGSLKIVGGVHDLQTGKVRFLPDAN